MRPGRANPDAATGHSFGKGSGYPAALNCGALFSYASAKDRNLPLLFKGNDVSEPDIVPAIQPAPP